MGKYDDAIGGGKIILSVEEVLNEESANKVDKKIKSQKAKLEEPIKITLDVEGFNEAQNTVSKLKKDIRTLNQSLKTAVGKDAVRTSKVIEQKDKELKQLEKSIELNRKAYEAAGRLAEITPKNSRTQKDTTISKEIKETKELTAATEELVDAKTKSRKNTPKKSQIEKTETETGAIRDQAGAVKELKKAEEDLTKAQEKRTKQNRKSQKPIDPVQSAEPVTAGQSAEQISKANRKLREQRDVTRQIADNQTEAFEDIGDASRKASDEVVKSQQQIQDKIKETNRLIENQRAWLSHLSPTLEASNFKTKGKADATKQLREWTARYVDYYRNQQERDRISEYAEERMIVGWNRAYQEAQAQGVAQSTLSRYNTSANNEYDFNRSLETLQKEYDYRVEQLKKYETTLAQLEGQIEGSSAATGTVVENNKKQVQSYEELLDTLIKYKRAMELLEKNPGDSKYLDIINQLKGALGALDESSMPIGPFRALTQALDTWQNGETSLNQTARIIANVLNLTQQEDKVLEEIERRKSIAAIASYTGIPEKIENITDLNNALQKYLELNQLLFNGEEFGAMSKSEQYVARELIAIVSEVQNKIKDLMYSIEEARGTYGNIPQWLNNLVMPERGYDFDTVSSSIAMILGLKEEEIPVAAETADAVVEGNQRQIQSYEELINILEEYKNAVKKIQNASYTYKTDTIQDVERLQENLQASSNGKLTLNYVKGKINEAHDSYKRAIEQYKASRGDEDPELYNINEYDDFTSAEKELQNIIRLYVALGGKVEKLNKELQRFDKSTLTSSHYIDDLEEYNSELEYKKNIIESNQQRVDEIKSILGYVGKEDATSLKIEQLLNDMVDSTFYGPDHFAKELGDIIGLQVENQTTPFQLFENENGQLSLIEGIKESIVQENILQEEIQDTNQLLEGQISIEEHLAAATEEVGAAADTVVENNKKQIQSYEELKTVLEECERLAGQILKHNKPEIIDIVESGRFKPTITDYLVDEQKYVSIIHDAWNAYKELDGVVESTDSTLEKNRNTVIALAVSYARAHKDLSAFANAELEAFTREQYANYNNAKSREESVWGQYGSNTKKNQEIFNEMKQLRNRLLNSSGQIANDVREQLLTLINQVILNEGKASEVIDPISKIMGLDDLSQFEKAVGSGIKDLLELDPLKVKFNELYTAIEEGSLKVSDAISQFNEFKAALQETGNAAKTEALIKSQITSYQQLVDVLTEYRDVLQEIDKNYPDNVKKPDLLEGMDILYGRGVENGDLFGTKSNQLKELKSILNAQLEMYEGYYQSYYNGVDEYKGTIYPADKDALDNQELYLSTYLALYIKMGGAVDKLNKKLREFAEANMIAEELQGAKDSYEADRQAALERRLAAADRMNELRAIMGYDGNKLYDPNMLALGNILAAFQDGKVGIEEMADTVSKLLGINEQAIESTNELGQSAKKSMADFVSRYEEIKNATKKLFTPEEFANKFGDIANSVMKENPTMSIEQGLAELESRYAIIKKEQEEIAEQTALVNKEVEIFSEGIKDQSDLIGQSVENSNKFAEILNKIRSREITGAQAIEEFNNAIARQVEQTDAAVGANNELADSYDNIAYHAGDLSKIETSKKSLPLGATVPRPVDSISPMNPTTGLYTTSDLGEFIGTEWQYAPISSIDLSYYKMLKPQNNEDAIEMAKFFNELNAYIYGGRYAFEGIMSQQNLDLSIEELYDNMNRVFNNVNMDINEFVLWIEQCKELIKDCSITETDRSTQIEGISKDAFYSDNFPTQLLKKLGYEGLDLRSTDYDGTYSGGTVVFDIKPESLVAVNEKFTDVISRAGLLEFNEADLEKENKRRAEVLKTSKIGDTSVFEESAQQIVDTVAESAQAAIIEGTQNPSTPDSTPIENVIADGADQVIDATKSSLEQYYSVYNEAVRKAEYFGKIEDQYESEIKNRFGVSLDNGEANSRHVNNKTRLQELIQKVYEKTDLSDEDKNYLSIADKIASQIKSEREQYESERISLYKKLKFITEGQSKSEQYRMSKEAKQAYESSQEWMEWTIAQDAKYPGKIDLQTNDALRKETAELEANTDAQKKNNEVKAKGALGSTDAKPTELEKFSQELGKLGSQYSDIAEFDAECEKMLRHVSEGSYTAETALQKLRTTLENIREDKILTEMAETAAAERATTAAPTYQIPEVPIDVVNKLMGDSMQQLTKLLGDYNVDPDDVAKIADKFKDVTKLIYGSFTSDPNLIRQATSLGRDIAHDIYEAGAEIEQAEPTYKNFLQTMRNRRIRYNDSYKSEYGDDWASVRRKNSSLLVSSKSKYYGIASNADTLFEELWRGGFSGLLEQQVSKIGATVYDDTGKLLIDQYTALKAIIGALDEARSSVSKTRLDLPKEAEREIEGQVAELFGNVYQNAQSQYASEATEAEAKLGEAAENAGKKMEESANKGAQAQKKLKGAVKEATEALGEEETQADKTQQFIQAEMNGLVDFINRANTTHLPLFDLNNLENDADLLDRIVEALSGLKSRDDWNALPVHFNKDIVRLSFYNKELETTLNFIARLKENEETGISYLSPESVSGQVGEKGKAYFKKLASFDVELERNNKQSELDKIIVSLGDIEKTSDKVKTAFKEVQTEISKMATPDDLTRVKTLLNTFRNVAQEYKNKFQSNRSLTKDIEERELIMRNAYGFIDAKRTTFSMKVSIEGYDKVENTLNLMESKVNAFYEAQKKQAETKVDTSEDQINAYNEYIQLKEQLETETKQLGAQERFDKFAEPIKNAAEEIQRAQETLNNFGDVQGIKELEFILQEMKDANDAFLNPDNTNADRAKAVQQYIDAKADFDQRVADIQSQFNQQEQNKADQIKNKYQELLTAATRYSEVVKEIYALQDKDKGTGLFTKQIEALQKERNVLVQQLTANGGAEGFLKDAETQAVLTTNEINKLTSALQTAQTTLKSRHSVIQDSMAEAEQLTQLLNILSQKGAISSTSKIGSAAISAKAIATDYYSQLITSKPDATQWSSQELNMLEQLIAKWKELAQVAVNAAQKEQQYFQGKAGYTFDKDTGITQIAQETVASTGEINNAKETLTAFVNELTKGRGIITGFKTDANGISTIDFSVLNEETNAVERFSYAMGQATPNIYDMSTALKNLTPGTDAAIKQFKNVTDLIGRLQETGIDASGLTDIQKRLAEGLSLQGKGDMTDAEYQSFLSALAKEANVSVKSVEKLYQKSLQLKQLVDSGKADPLGTIDKNGNIYEQMKTSVEQYAATSANASVEVGKFNEKTNELPFTLTYADGTVRTMTASFDTLTSSVTACGVSIKNIGTFGQRYLKSFGTIGQQLLRYTVGFSGIYRVVSEVKKGISAVKEIDLAMTELKKVTDETSATYNEFLTTAATKSQALGTTMKEFINSTADFARLGYTIEEATQLSEAANLYKNVGDNIDDVGTASESIISTMKAFGIEAENAMGIVDKFNEIGKIILPTDNYIG